MSGENEQGSDLHADLAAAFDAIEAPPPSATAAPPTEPVVAPPTEPTPESGPVRDDQGRFAPKAGEKAPGGPVEPSAPPTAPKEPTEPTAPSVETVRAPQSWKPAAREEWGKLPQAAQQEVLRREREVQVALQESSEARQGYQKFRETVAPYEAMFRAEGVDALKATQNLLQTAAALSSAPPQNKAALVARIIKAYNIDVDTLGQMLAGEVPTPTQQPAYRDPRVDDLLREVETAKAQRSRELERRATTAIKEVQAEEFFEDVRADMADLLELAARRGLQMTPKEAYNRAVLVHPEVSKVLQQRQAAQSAANPAGSTQRSRAAASSIRSTPAAPGGRPAQPESLRDAISAAFDSRSNE
jgi:hypothetical protein